MTKRSPKELLKNYSWCYIVMGVILLIFVIVMNQIPGFMDSLIEQSGDAQAQIMFNTTIAVSIAIYIWYFWLSRRVADGKSKGTLLLVLLVLNSLSELYTMFAGPVKGQGTIDLVLVLVGLWFLIKARQDN